MLWNLAQNVKGHWELHKTSREIIDQQGREFPQYANVPGLKGRNKNSLIETVNVYGHRQAKEVGTIPGSPVLVHAAGEQQAELKKVHVIAIVHNPGLQTRGSDDVQCPLCIHYPSAIIQGTSFHYRVNDHVNNKFYGLSTYC